MNEDQREKEKEKEKKQLFDAGSGTHRYLEEACALLDGSKALEDICYLDEHEAADILSEGCLLHNESRVLDILYEGTMRPATNTGWEVDRAKVLYGWGGPAVQVVVAEEESWVEVQDWFFPWTRTQSLSDACHNRLKIELWGHIE